MGGPLWAFNYTSLDNSTLIKTVQFSKWGAPEPSFPISKSSSVQAEPKSWSGGRTFFLWFCVGFSCQSHWMKFSFRFRLDQKEVLVLFCFSSSSDIAGSTALLASDPINGWLRPGLAFWAERLSWEESCQISCLFDFWFFFQK